jgi:hypothetical protein
MNEQYRDFGMRLRRIDRRHRKLSDGYVTSVNHDGLIIAVPRRRRIRVPFAGIALLAVGVLALKGMVHAQLGPEVYEARIAGLAQGGQIERAGAWVMQPDPLTLWISQQAATLMR